MYFLIQVNVVLSLCFEWVCVWRQVPVCFSDQASNYVELSVSGRPLKAGTPVQEPGEGPGKDTLLEGKSCPPMTIESPCEWLCESQSKQDSPVSGWDCFF